MNQKFFVLENALNSTVIGYLPGAGISKNFISFGLDEDSDGLQSISFDPVTEAVIVTDSDELDYEKLDSSKKLSFSFFLNSDEIKNTSYSYGYNYVEIYVEDVINENVNGTTANDTLITQNAGNTTIRGLGGNDVLTGSVGDDILIGGKGRDSLTGGAGADTFIIGESRKYRRSQKADRITDFEFSDSLVFDTKTFTKRLTFDAVNDNAYLKEKADRSVKTLVYDYSKGTMYFNENGALPGFGKGGLIAQFSNTLAGDVTIDASDCRMGSASI